MGLLNWFITSPIPLGVTLALYLLQAAGYAKLGSPEMALVFIAYAVANAGFIWHLMGLK